MLHHFAEDAATEQRSSGGGCTTHHRRLPRSAAVAGAAAQRSRCSRRVVAQHATISVAVAKIHPLLVYDGWYLENRNGFTKRARTIS